MSTTSTSHITLTPRGEFSLAASIRFLRGFTPLSPDGGEEHDETTLRLAFTVEGDWRPVAVSVQQTGDGRVSATIEGDAAAVQSACDQLERMLSLDVDASTLGATLAGDEVATALVNELRGLRPVCFASPYEAAAWAVISQRVQMRQAARIRVRMCEQLGARVEVGGRTLHSFPDPETLLATTAITSLTPVKIERLHAVADAALDGRLDGATLRAAGSAQAIEDVQRIAGIGPFSADLVVIRGAGEPDHFSRTERRLHGAMADAYSVDAADLDSLAAIAARWRPFRSWIGFLFRTRLSMPAR
jgi:DNA-3-methyladenine glycosylase II